LVAQRNINIHSLVIGDYKSCDIVYDFPATYRLQQMQLAGRELSVISTNKKRLNWLNQDHQKKNGKWQLKREVEACDRPCL